MFLMIIALWIIFCHRWKICAPPQLTPRKYAPTVGWNQASSANCLMYPFCEPFSNEDDVENYRKMTNAKRTAHKLGIFQDANSETTRIFYLKKIYALHQKTPNPHKSWTTETIHLILCTIFHQWFKQMTKWSFFKSRIMPIQLASL